MSIFYVSPDGNDAWTGTSATAAGTSGPFATLGRAIQAINSSPGANTVYVRAGTYNLTAPLDLTSANSNDSIIAYPGEKPVITGGTTVGGWTVGSDGVWTAQLPVSGVENLVVNGVAQPEARYPNYTASNPIEGGWAWAQTLPNGDNPATQLAFDKTVFSAAQLSVGEKVVVFAQNGYSNNVLTIQSVNYSSGVITFTEPADYAIGPGSRFYVEGSSALLDAPGEWYFNGATQTLSYLPPIGFTGTGAVASGGNNDLIDLNGANNVTISGLTLTNDATTTAYGDETTAAVDVINSSGDTISGNTFTNDALGVRVDGTSHGVSVSGNTFSQIQSAAISLTPSTYQNTISNNSINGVGTVYTLVGAIQMTESWGNTVSNNLIENVPRFGIAEDNYDPTTTSGGNTIEYNVVKNSGQETPDTGAIYVFSGGDPGALGDIIRYNEVINAGGLTTDAAGFVSGQNFSWGIYLDNQTSNAQVYGNFVSGTTNAAIMLHGGTGNQVYDNVLTGNAGYGVEALDLGSPMTGTSIYNNVVQVPAAGDAAIGLDTTYVAPSSVYGDIYVTPGGSAPTFGFDYTSYSGWQAAGGDKGSLVVTPAGMFTNPSAGNYAFAPGSVALAQSIPQLPWTMMGPVATPTPTPTPASTPTPAPTPTPTTVPTTQYSTDGTTFSTVPPTTVSISQKTYGSGSYTTISLGAQWITSDTVQVIPTTWSAGFSGNLAYDNFAQTKLNFFTAGTKALNILAIGAKSGVVTLDNGADTFTWVAGSNGGVAASNTMVINAGAGSDTIAITSAAASTFDDAHNSGDGSQWNPRYTGKTSTAEIHLGAGAATVTDQVAVKLQIYGGSGYDTIQGGSAADIFNVGSGGGDITGGGGADTFAFLVGDGHTRIEDFVPGTDKLQFAGLTRSDIKTAQTTESGTSGLMVTYDSGGDSVFLAHVTKLGTRTMTFT